MLLDEPAGHIILLCDRTGLAISLYIAMRRDIEVFDLKKSQPFTTVEDRVSASIGLMPFDLCIFWFEVSNILDSLWPMLFARQPCYHRQKHENNINSKTILIPRNQ